MGLEGSDLLFDGTELKVAAVISLDVGVDSPIFALLELFNDKGIGIGIGLDVAEEPDGKGFGDVVVVNTGSGIQVLDEYGVVRSSSCAHDSALVNVLDIAGLHGESVHNDGEIRHLSSIFFESLGTFDCVSVLIRAEALLEVFNSGSTTSSDGLEIGAVFSFLRYESFCKSMIPSCLGCGQCLVDVTLDIVSLLSEGGDKVLVSIFAVNGALQFVDSRVSDVLGQSSNGFGGKLIFPIVDEGEGALGIDDGGFGHFQDFGRHLEVNLGSKDFAILKRVIGRG